MTDTKFLGQLDRSGLTPKQRMVYDELKRRRTVPQIAKKMKISQAGVYGHIRALKSAVPPADHGEGAARNGNAHQALVPQGGYEQAVEVLDASLANERGELDKTNERLEGLKEEIKSLTELRDVRENRVTALNAARESLDSKLVAA